MSSAEHEELRRELLDALREQNPDLKDMGGKVWISGGCTPQTAGTVIDLDAVAEAVSAWNRRRAPQPVGEREAVSCAARDAYPDPMDCDWPHCGCDDRASKVVEALIEEGWGPPGKWLGQRLTEEAVERLRPGDLLRLHSDDPWFDPPTGMPANGEIVRFTGAVDRSFPNVGPHLEVASLGGQTYRGRGWVYRLFHFVASAPLPALASPGGLGSEEQYSLRADGAPQLASGGNPSLEEPESAAGAVDTTTTPGITASHQIITPTCRSNRGITAAFLEAMHRVSGIYEDYARANGSDAVNWHLVLTREEPGNPAPSACTCLDVCGEDPNCLFHGEGTEWARANPDPCAEGDR